MLGRVASFACDEGGLLDNRALLVRCRSRLRVGPPPYQEGNDHVKAKIQFANAVWQGSLESQAAPLEALHFNSNWDASRRPR